MVIRPVSDPPVFPTFIGKVDLLDSSFNSVTAQSLFVNGLYHDLLARGADQAGVNVWVSQLQAGVSRAQVVQGFYQSAEHRGLQVDRLYQAILHRNADPAGRASFVHVMQSGATEIDVSRALLASGEYMNAHAASAAFVAGLYFDVLGRIPDAAGQAGWVQLLQNGGSRQTMIQALLTSPETYTDILARDYAMLLNRPIDAGGQAAFLSLLLSGRATPDTAAEAILASNEYFQGSH